MGSQGGTPLPCPGQPTGVMAAVHRTTHLLAVPHAAVDDVRARAVLGKGQQVERRGRELDSATGLWAGGMRECGECGEGPRDQPASPHPQRCTHACMWEHRQLRAQADTHQGREEARHHRGAALVPHRARPVLGGGRKHGPCKQRSQHTRPILIQSARALWHSTRRRRTCLTAAVTQSRRARHDGGEGRAPEADQAQHMPASHASVYTPHWR